MGSSAENRRGKRRERRSRHRRSCANAGRRVYANVRLPVSPPAPFAPQYSVSIRWGLPSSRSGACLGDHVSDAYIQDVVVAPEFRRHGIGGAIVKTLAAELRRQGVEWIGLVGAPGTENFYRALGLTAPQGYTFYQVE